MKNEVLMNKQIKRIGVLTSGGDASGMNAAIRGVVHASLSAGIEVLGIYDGYEGLIAGNASFLGSDEVADIISRGGTFLRTARSPAFMTPEGVKKGYDMALELGLDALVVIGGNGSYLGALDLSRLGLPVIGIPATIDNDISSTEYTIGFDTAMNVALSYIECVRDTASAMSRCSIIEVMGRHAGYIAYYTALAAGAEAVLLPEYPYDLEKDVIEPIRKWQERGRKNYIIVAAEGVEGIKELPAKIKEALGMKPTYSEIGYMQRGGSPTVRDRAVASLMAEKAVSCLLNGEFNRLVTMQNGKIDTVGIEEGHKMTKKIEEALIRAEKNLSLR